MTENLKCLYLYPGCHIFRPPPPHFYSALQNYRRQEYKVIENTTPGPDEGIDLILKRDGRLVLVQCKHWKSTKVGANIVRELFGVITDKKATSGFLITSGVFTQEARNFAADKAIDLVDGTQLLQLLRKLRRK